MRWTAAAPDRAATAVEQQQLDILLADTKFELGVRDGKTLLIDEALTPDSSRMWSEADYRTGISPPSYDKQILRDWLETLDWNKEYPAPELDPEVVARVAERYLEVAGAREGTPGGQPLIVIRIVWSSVEPRTLVRKLSSSKTFN